MIFRLLLRYHSPSLTSVFESNQITPDFYATSWFITIFSSKTSDIETLFSLWEQVIEEKDKLFTCYLAVALLEFFKSDILSDDPTIIPQKILAIRLKSTVEVREIVRMAREFKKNMPYSLHSSLLRYDVFKLATIDEILSTLNKLSCLSILARDIMQRIYPEAQLCNNCQETRCECFPSTNALPVIVIDCRTQEEQEAGILPNSSLLNCEAFSNIEYLQRIPEDYARVRGVFHILLMGSGAFTPREHSASLREEQEEDLSDDEEEDYVQNMLENLLQVFLSHDFPYVSIVEGGFQKVHEFAMHYQLEIINHNPSMCLVCSPNRKKHNNMISEGLMKIKDKLVGRVRAFSSAVKGIVRSDSVMTPLAAEEAKAEKRKAMSRRPSVENFNNIGSK